MHLEFAFFYKRLCLSTLAITCAGVLGGCSLLGLGGEPDPVGEASQGINENVSAATVFGEKGVVLYDPLGDGSDFVLDPSGRIVKSDVDAAESHLEINDLERRFFLSSKHLRDARSFIKTGLYTEALTEINAALEYTPRSALGYALKGSAEYKLGSVDRARAAWMVALRLDPSMKSVSRALYLIDD